MLPKGVGGVSSLNAAKGRGGWLHFMLPKGGGWGCRHLMLSIGGGGGLASLHAAKRRGMGCRHLMLSRGGGLRHFMLPKGGGGGVVTSCCQKEGKEVGVTLRRNVVE